MPIIEVPGKGNVEFPDTMSHEDIVGAVKKISAPPPLQQAQERFQNPFGKTLGGVNIPGVGHPFQPGSAPASMAAPGAGGITKAAPLVSKPLGVLGNMLGQGAAGAGEALAQGRGPLSALKEGATGAAGAGVLGGLGHLALGLPAKAAAAKRAMSVFGEKTAAREAGIKGMEEAHALTGKMNKEMTGALNTLEKESFTASKAKFADDSAAAIAKDLKKNVPALKPFPETQTGLGDMLYGKGKNTVSRHFDKALKEVVDSGKGRMIQVPAAVAESFGVTAATNPAADLSPAIRDALAMAGRLPKDLAPPGMASVDAGELANAALGAWRKDPKSYRAAMEALDKANIGDPAARQAYKYYIGQLDYFNATKAMKGERFDPTAYRAGATTQNVEKLRRRGIGSLTEGPMELTKGGPLAPTPRQVPPQSPMSAPPAEIPKPDIRTMKNPLSGHPYAMGAGSESIAAALGHHGFGIPFVGGMALSNAMPKELVTQAPGVNPLIQALMQAITAGGGMTGSRLSQ